MKLPINIALKLQAMLRDEEIPSSSLKQAIVLKMVEDGAIQYKNISKSKRVYFISKKENLHNYLVTEFGINDFNQFIEQHKNSNLLRSDAVEISSDSKLKAIRSFKGFMVNSYQAIDVSINNNKTILQPTDGTFLFIYDFETFVVPENVIIVGIENPENFRYIKNQAHLFKNLTPIFVSRYPQTQCKDFIKWLKNNQNKYLHFGDFDFEGINIFLNEYKKHLGEKATFFIPNEIENLIQKYGNPNIYNTQIYKQPHLETVHDINLISLIQVIHKYKKGLEQEILINQIT